MSASPSLGDEFDTEGDERDYTTRLGDILGHSDDEQGSESDEDFVYDGKDAELELSGDYREQLSEVLEQRLDELDEIEDREHVGHLLSAEEIKPSQNDEVEKTAVVDQAPSPIPTRSIGRPSFLHPNVSRLRSFASRTTSVSSPSSVTGLPQEEGTPSHLSAVSRTSSTSNIHEGYDIHPEGKGIQERIPFRWSTMKGILEQVRAFSAAPQKAATVLGNAETPTVMAANGLICIGTSLGKIYVFDFKQNLRTVCAVKDALAVTAIALTQDRTFVAAGYQDGQIHLFNLSDTSKPVRSVPTLPRAAVVSGRREGHLHGSRITHIGFVGPRHTAIVSADEYGMAFYHSLGKVLFVEATDVLRLLGKYPEEPQARTPTVGDPERSSVSTAKSPRRHSRWIRQSPHILSMVSLPLGSVPNPTDAYNITAIITPIKLVIVALKPSPKTWFRKRRAEDRYAALVNEIHLDTSACLSWYPSISVKNEDSPEGGMRNTIPTLLYTWGSSAMVLTIREELAPHHVKSQKRGMPHEDAKLLFEEVGSWTAGDEIRAVQWLTPFQALLVMDFSIEVWDIRDGCKLIERASFSISTLASVTLRLNERKVRSYEQSVCAYKGKLFLLGAKDILVGTLLTWTDHILGLVEHGDSLAAIELATAYHLGTAPGNQSGLPRIAEARKQVTGNQLRELMQASVRHAFSPERLTDSTHRTADNRGVDLTSLFEGLVPTCIYASIALENLDFVYEDLFDYYQEAGIERIFLTALTPFLLDGVLTLIPPWITQHLISMYEEKGDLSTAEALIWHLDPLSLDVNQAIQLCRDRGLWDALIYVYIRALKDYVGPVVELISLVRRVQKLRQTAGATGITPALESAIEKDTINAYKVFPYIAATLSGLIYPSQVPLSVEEGSTAKADLYGFLTDGRSRIWPTGPTGKLVLTNDEEGGTEPTYPYLRLLLRFDPESMLHTLDIALEDSYLNDDNQGVGRLIIMKILLEMLNTGDFPPSDATLIRIFVARNVPKYPQYIKMPPSLLHSVLVELASDKDVETREDRQLAAEYLLSAYKPREGDDLVSLFESAGFYRILRSRFRAERQWSSLLEAYLQDLDIPSAELFVHLDEVVVSSSKKGIIPRDVILVVMDSLPRLLAINLNKTALFIDKRMPDQHPRALELLEGDDERQLVYLRTLLEPSKALHGPYEVEPRPASQHIDQDGQRLFFELMCRTEPDGLVEALSVMKPSTTSLKILLPIFKQNLAHDALIFLLSDLGNISDALDYIEKACRTEASRITNIVENRVGVDQEHNIASIVDRIKRMSQRSIALCKDTKISTISADERWLRLLQAQILLVQGVVDAASLSGAESLEDSIEELRSLVHQSFDALLLHSSTQGISFPQLFRDLVTSTTEANKYSEEPSTELYTEFRTILTGMLDTYRYDGELLTTTAALVNRDVNAAFEGW
ncbi:Vacuolar protein sorting-associated protein 8, partial [Serendipita sp. 407]